MLLQTNRKEQKEWGDCVTAAILINAQLMCVNPGMETVAKLYEVKLKLEQISICKTEDGMIRSGGEVGCERWRTCALKLRVLDKNQDAYGGR